MSAKYGDEIKVEHLCEPRADKRRVTAEVNADIANEARAGNTDEEGPVSAQAQIDQRVVSIFFDYKEDHPGRDAHLQRLRDARNKNTAPEVNGKILTCIDCGSLFTTTEVVDMALNRYKKLSSDSEKISVPMPQYRLDLAAYRYTYDYPDLTAGSTDFWRNKDVRYILLTRKFNEHDSNHRLSCFKKGCECRFLFPLRSCAFTDIPEDPGENDENKMDWYFDL